MSGEQRATINLPGRRWRRVTWGWSRWARCRCPCPSSLSILTLVTALPPLSADTALSTWHATRDMLLDTTCYYVKVWNTIIWFIIFWTSFFSLLISLSQHFVLSAFVTFNLCIQTFSIKTFALRGQFENNEYLNHMWYDTRYYLYYCLFTLHCLSFQFYMQLTR